MNGKAGQADPCRHEKVAFTTKKMNGSGREKSNTRILETIDAREMFLTADLYSKTAENLFYRAKEKNESQLPTVVLASLAVEIFLKCLLKVETDQTPPASHDILFLFRQIPHELRDRMRTLHDAELKAEEPTLLARLESGRLAFKRWRYAYEPATDEKGEAYGLNWLGEITRSIILERYPEWAGGEAASTLE